jgi:hypothetical protein
MNAKAFTIKIHSLCDMKTTKEGAVIVRACSTTLATIVAGLYFVSGSLLAQTGTPYQSIGSRTAGTNGGTFLINESAHAPYPPGPGVRPRPQIRHPQRSISRD